jgi:putative FmdB family regulatory protein
MPIYAYRCGTCGHAQDVLQKISDPLLTVCPACGAPTYEKQVTAAGFQLKGSGWYVTDFRDGHKAGAKKEAGQDAPAGADQPAAAAKTEAGAPAPAPVAAAEAAKPVAPAPSAPAPAPAAASSSGPAAS